MEQQNSKLISLPGEIQNMIYEFVLAPTGSVAFLEKQHPTRKWFLATAQHSSRAHRRCGDCIDLQFLLVCKKFYSEARPTFFSKNSFVFVVGQDSWLTSMASHGSIEMRHLSIEMSPEFLEPQYANIPEAINVRTWEFLDLIRLLYRPNLSSRKGDKVQMIELHLPARCDIFEWVEDWYSYNWHVRQGLAGTEEVTFTAFLEGMYNHDEILHHVYPIISELLHKLQETRLANSTLQNLVEGLDGGGEVETTPMQMTANAKVELKVIANSPSWDDEQETLLQQTNPKRASSQTETQTSTPPTRLRALNSQNNEVLPNAVYETINHVFGGSLWHNGTLIYQDGEATAPAYRMDAPFEHPLLTLFERHLEGGAAGIDGDESEHEGEDLEEGEILEGGPLEEGEVLGHGAGGQ